MSVLILLLQLIAAPTTDDELGQKLLPMVKAHRGKVAVAVKEMKSGKTWFYQPNQVMPTASLIKIPVLLEAWLQITEGRLTLKKKITLQKKDKVPGSGILTSHFADGTTFPFETALHLMIAVSDNTATNLVLDQIGIKAVNGRMAKWGLLETRVNAKVYRGSTTSVDPQRTKKYGLGSTTAGEMLKLLEMIETGAHFKPAVKQAILTQLKKTEDKKKFRRLLPRSVTLAHKTGSVSHVRTNAGILYFDNTAVLLCVLTAQNKDRSWGAKNEGDLLCAKIAQKVYEHYHKRISPKP